MCEGPLNSLIYPCRRTASSSLWWKAIRQSGTFCHFLHSARLAFLPEHTLPFQLSAAGERQLSQPVFVAETLGAPASGCLTSMKHFKMMRGATSKAQKEEWQMAEKMSQLSFFLETKVNGGTAGVRFGLSCPISLKKEAAVKSAELKKHFFCIHFFEQHTFCDHISRVNEIKHEKFTFLFILVLISGSDNH